MPNQAYLLGIDQGTSGSRALVLDRAGQVLGYSYRPLARLYPRPGWVEQEPDAVAGGVAAVMAEAIDRAGCRPHEIAACGIASQRNTDFVWDARTGRPLANAITWQDLRTMPLLAEVEAWPLAEQGRRRLGYFPGPYSSSFHMAWRMRHDPAVAQAARAGHLRMGCAAAWLLATMGRPVGHHMDYTLVQAIGMFDFRAKQYWDEWLSLLGIPPDPLPTPMPTVYDFGTLRVAALDGATADVPVLAIIGDQQAALFGHDCRSPGDAKCTHGTSSFVNVCTGDQAPYQERLNVYFAWYLDDRPTYCLETETTATGAAIRWMREHARFFDHHQELGPLAVSVPDSGGVVFVPAFTGIFVPDVDFTARGTILGLTLGSTRAHIVRAFLESLGYQLRTILETVEAEAGMPVERLHLSGGVSASDEACQIQADLIGIPTVRVAFTETAARAAALLAGLGAGVWTGPDDLPPLPDTHTVFEPRLSANQRDVGYARWQRAVERARGWSEE